MTPRLAIGRGGEALECGSKLPLSSPRACSRGSQLIHEFPTSQQAGWRQSGSEPPHSKASHACTRCCAAKSALRGLTCQWLTLAGLCCLASVLRAQTPAPTNADAYVRQFESSYHDVQSLRAEFTQTYTVGERTQNEGGIVAFARGGVMRWDYQRPSKKVFVSDGKHVSLYIPDEQQLTRTPIKSSEDFRVPFELLLTRLNLRRVFSRVEMADAALDHDPADHVLRAFPKKQYAEDYSDVLIELGPQFDMRRLVVNYPDHGRMDFRFDHIERNPPLPRSLFQFQPPAGTEIIDQH